jgi:KDO2-lipid IV(A) lauroyltransferase
MSERKPLSSYWQPKYWPIWIGMALLRLVCLLPHRAVLATGRVIGRIAHATGGTRRAIVRRNIELCFPEMTAEERDALAYEHFKALGISLMELGLGRWASTRHLQSITQLNGVEHVQDALASGKGVILLSAHFTTLEVMGRVLAAAVPPFDAVFRKNRSEFMTELQRSGREISAANTIEKRAGPELQPQRRRGHYIFRRAINAHDCYVDACAPRQCGSHTLLPDAQR